MLELRRILVPVDSSAGAEAALHLGRYMARRRGAGAVSVVHVGENPAAARNFEDDFRARLGPGMSEIPKIEFAAVTGERPASSILRFARKDDVDMIVMGKHGSRTTDRLLTYLGAYGQVIGSTAEYVVRASRCPVILTSPRFVRGPVDVRRILVAIDFSVYTPAAIRLGRELRRVFDAEVEYIHVKEGPGNLDKAWQADGNNGIAAHEFSVEQGLADRVILDHVRQRGIDLLAIHSHGTTGDRRARIGHVAEKLIQAAPCSVLTVKSFGKSPVRPDDSDRELADRMHERAGVV